MKKLCIELDDKVLNQVEGILSEIGMNSEEAINLFFAKIKNDNGILLDARKSKAVQHRKSQLMIYNQDTLNILQIIDEIMRKFSNDCTLKHHIKPAQLIDNRIDVPDLFQSYISYQLFHQQGSAIIRLVLYRAGYIIELVDGIYYVTRECGDRRIGMVTQEYINLFGNPETTSEENIISLIEHMDRMGHFGI